MFKYKKIKQIHFYTTPKLYDGFKECISEINENSENKYTASKILRSCMTLFNTSDDFKQLILNNLDGGVIE